MDPEQVDTVRADARRMVRELGFLDQTLAATSHPASAVHALIEIDRTPGITAAELAEVLLLDRSTVSRMLRKLTDAGEVRDDTSSDDRRRKTLVLTDSGRRTVAAVHEFGTTQVHDAFSHLPERDRATVSRGLHLYADALVRHRRQDPPPPRDAGIELDPRRQPGDLGRIVALHAREYAAISGFGAEFEAMVAHDIASFVTRDHPDSRLWAARDDEGRVLGSIAVDLAGGPDDAHLRWFLLSPEARGAGVGRRLLDAAVSHADAHGVRTTVLWTFRGLDTARAMYERHGFTLTLEQPGERWGSTVIEQEFRRTVVPDGTV